jgi:succinoglycan biosynthesis transport protein ExoP
MPGRPSQPPPTNLPVVSSQPTAPVPYLPQGGGYGGEEPGTDWRRYWAAVRRYRYWVVLVTALGLAGGVAATRMMKPQYLTQATIWIEGGSNNPRGPIRPEQVMEAAGWVDMLHSYVVLDQVVRNMRLYLQPGNAEDSTALANLILADRFRPGHYRLTMDADGHGFVLTTDNGVVVQRGTVGDSVGLELGLHWLPPASALSPGRTIDFDVFTPRSAAKGLADNLKVKIDDNGNFMRVELLGTVPERIAAIVNAVTQREVEVAAELKRAKLTELTSILNDQLTSAGRNLHQAENALETFRVQTITLPSERATPVAPGLTQTTSPVINSYFEMKVEREQLRRDREAIQRVLAQVPDSGLSVDGLAIVSAVQQSPNLKRALDDLTAKQAELRALRYKYADAHPLVQRTSAQVDSLQRQTIPMLARTLIGEISTRERVLDDRVTSASQDLRAIPSRSIEEMRLQREVAIADNLYTTLQSRYEEARLAAASSIADLRIFDAAVAPQQPVKDTATRLLLIGLLGGLGLGILGAIVLDRVDTRFRYPDQVTHDLGLPILGALPHINGKRNGKPSVDTAHVVESLRTIRMNLTHGYGAAGPMLVTISSPGPGDGKSFLSANLAIAFADAGFQTLLVDGDLRRGALHRLLNVSRKPGLTDFLSGAAEQDAIVQHTAYPQLSFIGGGSRKHTAPELLGSPRMMELIAHVRSTYNVVLVDTAPLGAAVDPFLLATMTGNLLLVMRTGTTDRELARAKLEMLDRLPVRILGAVLNDVKAEGAYRYYGYIAGYDVGEEAEPAGAGGGGGKQIHRSTQD